jgi:hypothetical protein
MSNAAQTGSSPEAGSEAPERHYDLSIRTSRAFVFFVNTNRGVTLRADRLAWTCSGENDAALFSSIRSVHLQTSGSWESPLTACRITFADRYELEVTDADRLGYPDPERRQPWRDFVHELHARLLASGNAAIRYTAGLQGHRYPVLIGLTILLAAIFVIVPVLAMLRLQSFEPVMIMLAGAGLIWPLYRMIEKNAPATYDPRHLPKDLLS